MMASSISSSWSMLTGPPDWRIISPWVRNSGGSPTRRCRSDDFDCTSARSRSPRVRSAAWYCPAAKSAGSPLGATGAPALGAAAGAAAAGARGALDLEGAAATGGLAVGAGAGAGAPGGGDGLRGSGALLWGHDGGQPPHLGDDAHPDHATVRDVFEL